MRRQSGQFTKECGKAFRNIHSFHLGKAELEIHLASQQLIRTGIPSRLHLAALTVPYGILLSFGEHAHATTNAREALVKHTTNGTQ